MQLVVLASVLPCYTDWDHVDVMQSALMLTLIPLSQPSGAGGEGRDQVPDRIDTNDSGG